MALDATVNQDYNRCSYISYHQCSAFIIHRIVHRSPIIVPRSVFSIHRSKMSFDFNTRLEHSPEVLFRVLKGESVLLDLDGEFYYGLDGVGTRVWSRNARATSAANRRPRVSISAEHRVPL